METEEYYGVGGQGNLPQMPPVSVSAPIRSLTDMRRERPRETRGAAGTKAVAAPSRPSKQKAVFMAGLGGR